MDDSTTTERKPKFDSSQIMVNNTPFLILALDLPPPPVFQDAIEKNIIPQVTLQSLLGKYDGVSTQVCHTSFLFSYD
jgi:U4/U6.U5 tri-snRNP-associated protein 2